MRLGLEAFANPGLTRSWGALLATGFAAQIQTVAVGWQVYDLTRNPLDLGLVGLSQFLPALLLVVVTGAVADRYPRRAILSLTLCFMACVSPGLVAITQSGAQGVGLIFELIVIFGAPRAFYNPARQSIIANLVPPAQLSGAVAVNASTNPIGIICGPVAGGIPYAIEPVAAYAARLCLFVTAAVLSKRFCACLLISCKAAQPSNY